MLQGFALKSASTIIFILLVGLVFYFVPNAAVRFRDVWVGAVLTGLLWRGALAGFSWYVRDMSRFSIHGSIAAVVVFLVWVYISAVILLFGAQVTAAYARLRRRRPDEIPAAPTPRVTILTGRDRRRASADKRCAGAGQAAEPRAAALLPALFETSCRNHAGSVPVTPITVKRHARRRREGVFRT